jgi:hypothetical protein
MLLKRLKVGCFRDLKQCVVEMVRNGGLEHGFYFSIY